MSTDPMKRLPVTSTPLAFYRYQPKTTEANMSWSATLVLGHALGADRHMWDRVVPLLPNELQVVLWEQPGHGGSDLLEDPALGAFATADALAAGLDELGIDRFHLAGLSLGGTVALAFTQKYPKLPESLTMFSSGAVLLPSSMWTDRAKSVKDSGLEPLADGTMERWFSPEFRESSGIDEVERTRATFVGTNPDGYAQCCQIIANTDLRPGVPQVQVRTQLIVGENDPGMTPDQALELAQNLPDGSVKVIEHVRHLSAVEVPEDVATHLRRIAGS